MLEILHGLPSSFHSHHPTCGILTSSATFDRTSSSFQFINSPTKTLVFDVLYVVGDLFVPPISSATIPLTARFKMSNKRFRMHRENYSDTVHNSTWQSAQFSCGLPSVPEQTDLSVRLMKQVVPLGSLAKGLTTSGRKAQKICGLWMIHSTCLRSVRMKFTSIETRSTNAKRSR